MAFFSKLRGTLSSIFQLGKAGPNLKNNSGAVETRNNADAGFAVHRALQPAGDNDLVDRQTFYNVFANPNDPYTYCLGDALVYGGTTGSPQGVREIQYTRVWLPAGRTLASMRTWVNSGANGVRLIQLGVYSQTSPTSPTGVPGSLVASTPSTAIPNATTGYYTLNLSSAYAVPTSGFYWLALQCDNAAFTFALSDVYRAGFANRREETPATFGLPATAGATTQPQSAIIFCMAVE